jgi:hypothetical protein
VSVTTTPPPAFNDDRLVLIGMRRTDLSRLEIRANGASVTTGTVEVLNVSNAFRPIFIGAHGEEPVQQLRGAIREIVAVRGPLSPTEVQALEDYLAQKHGLR